MNELKRYDQALSHQLEHLPMPPEDFAWAEMKKMLDEDDDDPVIVPFFRRPGCILPALIAILLLLIGGWFYFQKFAAGVPSGEAVPVSTDKTGNSHLKTDSSSNSITSGIQGNDPTRMDTTINDSITKNTITTNSTTSNTTGDNLNNTSSAKINIPGKSKVKISTSTAVSENNSEGKDQNTTKRKAGFSSSAKSKTKATIQRPADDSEETTGYDNEKTGRKNNNYTDNGKTTITVQPGSLDSSITKNTMPDSNKLVKNVKTDSLPQKKKTFAETPSEEKKEKEKFWQMAAGLSVYQPIALNGEPTVPYNAYGRKGSLADYIPAAHFRLYRSRQWFAHIEFRYGAPQPVEPFNYKQEVNVDSFQAVIRNVYQLQKTYYHQVPLSFHYYVLPGLSLGAGVTYNHFSAVVAQKEEYRGAVTQDTLLSTTIIRDKEAGKFIKNHFQWTAELQYQWKRLTLGARYSADINPYIKFNDIITGESIEKKTRALNVFLRYDLWRSKKWGK